MSLIYLIYISALSPAQALLNMYLCVMKVSSKYRNEILNYFNQITTIIISSIQMLITPATLLITIILTITMEF